MEALTLALKTNWKENKVDWQQIQSFLTKLEQDVHRPMYLSRLVCHDSFAHFAHHVLDCSMEEDHFLLALRMFLEMTFSFDTLKEGLRQVSVDNMTRLVSFFMHQPSPITSSYMNQIYPLQLRLLNQLCRNAVTSTDSCLDETKSNTLLPPMQLLESMESISLFTKLYSCFAHLEPERDDIIRIIGRITDSFEILFCLLSLPQLGKKFIKQLQQPFDLKIHMGQLYALFELFLQQYTTACTEEDMQLVQVVFPMCSPRLSCYFARPLPRRELLDHLLSNVALHMLRFTDMFFDDLVSFGNQEKTFAQFLANCVDHASLCLLRDSMNTFWSSPAMRPTILMHYAFRICQFRVPKWFPQLRQWKLLSTFQQVLEDRILPALPKPQRDMASNIATMIIGPKLTIASVVRVGYRLSLANECFYKGCTQKKEASYQKNSRLQFVQNQVDKLQLPVESVTDTLAYKSCSACHLAR